jgi:tRNA nucleotidyltransferase (CCA-adding enzyme)
MNAFQHYYLAGTGLPAVNELFCSKGKQLRFVGGCVRDWQLGVTPKDLDLCTDALPDEMVAFLGEAGYEVILTGLQHGTITVIVNGTPCEITTLRVDTETDGRHATVEFTTSFEADAARRDLTINAMSMDFDGKLYDYFDGKRDLQEKFIRFVGDAETRIREDYLRILRYYRFKSQLGFTKSSMGVEAVIFDNRAGLEQISVERIWSEMKKLLVGEARVSVVNAMFNNSILKTIGLVTETMNIEQVRLTTNPVTALWLLGGSKAQWSFSKEERKLLDDLDGHSFAPHTADDVVVMQLHGFSDEFINALIDLYARPNAQMMRGQLHIPPPVFPVTGYDMINMGFKPGKALGENLKILRKRWMDSQYKLTKEQLLEDDGRG